MKTPKFHVIVENKCTNNTSELSLFQNMYILILKMAKGDCFGVVKQKLANEQSKYFSLKRNEVANQFKVRCK